MDDLISRQYAIRIVDGIDTWQAGWRGNAIESMKALPSAQPEHWIPVTERLPKNDEKVLVTVKNGEVLFGNYHGKHWAYGSKVVAWMPLPEPYQAKRKKEKESE